MCIPVYVGHNEVKEWSFFQTAAFFANKPTDGIRQWSTVCGHIDVFARFDISRKSLNNDNTHFAFVICLLSWTKNFKMTDIEMPMDVGPSISGVSSKPSNTARKQHLPW